MGEARSHIQLNGAYTGRRTPVITVADARKTGDLPGYFQLDGTIGAVIGNMSFELFARNLTDARGQQTRAARCNINYCGPTSKDPIGEVYRIYIQPRTIGVRFGQKF